MKFFLFIPGWATTKEIFKPIEEILNTKGIKVNYFEYHNYLPIYENFETKIKPIFVDKNVIPIGWSMGGMLLTQFLQNNNICIESMLLVSSCLQTKIASTNLNKIRIGIETNKTRELKRFYSLATYDKKNFKFKNVIPDIESFDNNWLLSGLDYLENTNLQQQKSESICNKIKVIHGLNDQVINFEQAKKIESKFKGAELIAFEKSGHIPFLEEPEKFVNILLSMYANSL